MHGFMKKSDYSCTVTIYMRMHVQKKRVRGCCRYATAQLGWSDATVFRMGHGRLGCWLLTF